MNGILNNIMVYSLHNKTYTGYLADILDNNNNYDIRHYDKHFMTAILNKFIISIA